MNQNKLSEIEIKNNLKKKISRHDFDILLNGEKIAFEVYKNMVKRNDGKEFVDIIANFSYVPNDIMMDNKTNILLITGPNMSGKSTFLRILSGELDSTKGEVILGKGERLSVLKQNHNEFDSFSVLDTVIMGNSVLYNIRQEKNNLYMKENLTDEDGIKVGELEEKFANMNGWQAESDAAILLAGLGIKNDQLEMKMSELKDALKVKVKCG